MRGALDAEIAECLPSVLRYCVRFEQALRNIGIPYLDAEDLAQESLLLMVTGEREWDPSRVDMRGFLCGCVRSRVHSYKKAMARAYRNLPKYASEFDTSLRLFGDTTYGYTHHRRLERVKFEPSRGEYQITIAGGGPTPHSLLSEAEEDQAVLAEMLAACRGDRDLKDLVAVVRLGAFKRRDMARELGSTVDVVTAARVKLQRRLVRNGRADARSRRPARTAASPTP